MNKSEKRRGRRPVESLTEPQRRTLAEVQGFIARHSFPPSVQELADILGISSASAHEQINQLVRKGFIKREPRKARGISILRDIEDRPAELVPVPVLGSVTAGRPVLAEENFIGEVLIQGGLVRSGQCFALRVKGQSMVNADIEDRDLVIVRQQPIAENGDIVVAMIGDEATVKRLSIKGSHIELRPENPEFETIIVDAGDELRILGKVVAVRHTSDDSKQ